MANLSPYLRLFKSQPRRKLLSRKASDALMAYILLAPALLILLAFTFFPLGFGFYISLFTGRWPPRSGIEPSFANYSRAIEVDSELWSSLLTTVVYSLLSVPVQLGLAMFFAVLLFQNIRGKPFFRVAMFLPYITSTVASAAVWARLYSPDIGLINGALKALGLPTFRWLIEDKGIFQLAANAVGLTLPSWLNGPSLALISVVIYTTWVFVGYDTTIFLAGLGNIPKELYEAAKLDGAGSWGLFRHITVPLLSPTTFFLSLITIIGTFKAFNHIWVMTQGGNGTETASVLIYRQMYEFQRAGYASALAFLLCSVILIMTLIQNRVAGSRVNY